MCQLNDVPLTGVNLMKFTRVLLNKINLACPLNEVALNWIKIGFLRASGLLIWRVENFKPVRIAEEFYGQFYVGDSYIVLSSIIEGDYKSMNLHFWLGKEKGPNFESKIKKIFNRFL